MKDRLKECRNCLFWESKNCEIPFVDRITSQNTWSILNIWTLTYLIAYIVEVCKPWIESFMWLFRHWSDFATDWKINILFQARTITKVKACYWRETGGWSPDFKIRNDDTQTAYPNFPRKCKILIHIKCVFCHFCFNVYIIDNKQDY